MTDEQIREAQRRAGALVNHNNGQCPLAEQVALDVFALADELAKLREAGRTLFRVFAAGPEIMTRHGVRSPAFQAQADQTAAAWDDMKKLLGVKRADQ